MSAGVKVRTAVSVSQSHFSLHRHHLLTQKQNLHLCPPHSLSLSLSPLLDLLRSQSRFLSLILMATMTHQSSPP